MKKLLLTSAIVAVAGAATAEVTWSGGASLGYKSHFEVKETTKDADGKTVETDLNGDTDFEDSFYFENDDATSPLYFEADLTATASADLGNGVTASLAYDFDLADAGRSGEVTPGGNAITFNEGFPTLTVEAPMGKLAIGEVAHAAESMVSELHGSAVEFTEDKDDLVLRGDTTYSGIDAAISYVVADNNDGGADANGLNKESWTVGAKGEFAGASVALGYENAENSDGVSDANTALGLSAGYSMMGITGRLVYMTGTNGKTDEVKSSIGVAANYEMSNGVKLGAEFAMNSTDADSFMDADGEASTDADGATYDAYNSYKVWAGFNAMGADITLGYKDKNSTESAKDDNYGTAGVYFDATYAVADTGVTVMAGYDATDKITMYADEAEMEAAADDEVYGAYYVGASYAIAENATIKGTYSNGTEINPAEDIKPGITLGVALTF